jgi:hypothetical protein
VPAGTSSANASDRVLGVARTEVADSLSSPAAQTGDEAKATTKRGLGRPTRWGVAVGVVLTASIGGALLVRPRPSSLPLGAAPEAAAPAARAELVFRPRDVKRMTFGYACEEFPSLTPDGRTVVYDGEAQGDSHLYALDLASSAQREITDEAGWQYAPAVSPDGRSVAYLWKGANGLTQNVVSIDGAAESEHQVGKGRIRPRWTPDGRALWVGHERAERLDLATGEVTRSGPTAASSRG